MERFLACSSIFPYSLSLAHCNTNNNRTIVERNYPAKAHLNSHSDRPRIDVIYCIPFAVASNSNSAAALISGLGQSLCVLTESGMGVFSLTPKTHGESPQAILYYEAVSILKKSLCILKFCTRTLPDIICPQHQCIAIQHCSETASQML